MPPADSQRIKIWQKKLPIAQKKFVQAAAMIRGKPKRNRADKLKTRCKKKKRMNAIAQTAFRSAQIKSHTPPGALCKRRRHAAIQNFSGRRGSILQRSPQFLPRNHRPPADGEKTFAHRHAMLNIAAHAVTCLTPRSNNPADRRPKIRTATRAKKFRATKPPPTPRFRFPGRPAGTKEPLRFPP